MKKLVTLLFALACWAPSLLTASERKAPEFIYQSDEESKSILASHRSFLKNTRSVF